ncbi:MULTISPECIES: cytochrome c oxidase subunit II [unclassified Massilia]|uniref:cytochrome c oxidase subunit II n=1 Tax=unclassified Massilia TaxID=2609279 RepID=UPI000AEB4CB1|nr:MULTISPECIES: cytochrome c oxidase subunit II [unclassified Massilia]
MSAAFFDPQPLQDALHTAGVQADHIGSLWNLTLGLCTLVFVLVLGACLFALWRAPRAEAGTAPDLRSLTQPERRTWRTIKWATAAATVGLVALLVGDVLTSRALARMPLRDAVNIELVGHMWWWEARYRDPDPAREFSTANELHIPVGRPVVVTLRSEDVIHSLWIPNLQGKKDLIPGRTATLRLRADRAGSYRGQCAEFCGLEHAMMALLVEAEPNERYEAWAAGQRQPAAAPADALAQRGREVFLSRSCARCHTIAGTAANARLGPDLSHLASRRTIAAGMFPNNRGHLGGWIADPQSLKPGVNMPANKLPPDDLQALLAYLETLK